jgi:uncharacterized protein YxjI
MLRRALHRDDEQSMGPRRYQMRERLISIGGDYNVDDEHGQRAFHIDGKALRLRHTMKFQDPQGHDIYTIQERVVRVRESMAIDRDGQKVAEIHKALVTPLRDRLTVNIENGSDMTVQGNLLDHEYEITQGGRIRIRDTYGVEVSPGQDDALILAVTCCVDAMVHDD